MVDLNGFLVLRGGSKGQETKVRPDAGKFMELLAEKANVVVWSCMIRKNVDRILAKVLEGSKLKPELLTVLTQTEATKSSYRNEENPDKQIMLKDLKVVQEKLEHVDLSRTLLIDDTWYKNLLNDYHDAIFPIPWTGLPGDKFLMSTLHPWLESMFKSGQTVQKYVRNNYPEPGFKDCRKDFTSKLATEILDGCK